MPKKLKLNIQELKVQSFVTLLSEDEKNVFKGGGTDIDDCSTQSCLSNCVTCPPICTNTGGGCTGHPACCN